MNLQSIFSDAISFISGIVPSFFKMGDLLENIKKLAVVGVEKNQAHKITLACDALDGVAEELGDMQAEIYEFSSKLRQSLSPDSEAGTGLSLNEMVDLSKEAGDIPAEAKDIVARIGDLSKAVKAAIKE